MLAPRLCFIPKDHSRLRSSRPCKGRSPHCSFQCLPYTQRCFVKRSGWTMTFQPYVLLFPPQSRCRRRFFAGGKTASTSRFSTESVPLRCCTSTSRLHRSESSLVARASPFL